MTNGPSDAEQVILARLRKGLAAVDSPPEDVTRFAEAAFTWRTIDAELAEIAFDSAESESPAGVRGPGTARALSFESEAISIEVEYHRDTERLIGQIAPIQPARIELRRADGTTETETDDLGRFTFDGVTPGPASLVCRLARDAAQVVKTDWTLL